MTIHQSYIGCDIAKAMLDVFDPGSRRVMRMKNGYAALQAFAATLEPATSFVVLEATGHHDRLLRHALGEAGISIARVNPLVARRFAEGRGRLPRPIGWMPQAEQLGAMFEPSSDPALSQNASGWPLCPPPGSARRHARRECGIFAKLSTQP